MKLNANYSRKSYNEKGDIELTLTIPKQYHIQIDKLDTERIYELDIKERSNQRTLAQNRMMWALIDEIDLKENGRKSEDSVNELYKTFIKMARIYVRPVKFPLEDLEAQSYVYRVIDVRQLKEYDGVMFVGGFGYLGSSHFKTKEMSDFVETILDYASKIGLEITYYNEGLKNLIENN